MNALSLDNARISSSPVRSHPRRVSLLTVLIASTLANMAHAAARPASLDDPQTMTVTAADDNVTPSPEAD